MTKVTVNIEFDSLAEYRAFATDTGYRVPNTELGVYSDAHINTQKPQVDPHYPQVPTPADEPESDTAPTRKRRSPPETRAVEPVAPKKTEPVAAAPSAPTTIPDKYDALKKLAEVRGMEYGKAFLAEFFEVAKLSEVGEDRCQDFVNKVAEDLSSGPLLPNAPMIK